jgi:RecB family exonuclease
VTLPQVQIVLSKIKFYQKKASSSDLEKILFLNQSKSYCSYTEFKENFSSPFYSFEELWDKIKEKIPGVLTKDLKLDISSINLHEEIDRKEFFTRFSSLFEEHLEGEVFDHVISELFNGSHQELSLQISDWVEWVILSLQKLEIKIENQPEGVRIDSLMSSQSFNSKYVYVLGVDDTYFANTHDVDIDPEDILSLASELGYYLDHPDYNFRTYELETLKEKTQNELILSYALRDLKGEISNPSSVWQKLAFEQKLTEKHTDLYIKTLWDEHQTSDPEKFFLAQNPKYDFANYIKDQDLTGYKALSNLTTEYSLSPSSVKSFAECRFKFYMQKEISVDEADVEEIDISSKEKGQWYHRVYQLIIESWDTFIIEWQACDSEAKQLVYLQEKFAKEIPKTISNPFWQKIRNRYYRSIISFIQHEQQLRQQFPQIQNLGCEVKWKAYYDEDNQVWLKEKPAKGFLFRGTIDRVLLNKATGKVWLVDYKLGTSQVQSFSAWAKEHNWQLMYYTMAIESGWVENLPAYPVEVAQYWVVSKWNIKRGYSDGLTADFILKSKNDLLKEDQKKQLAEKFNEFILAQVSQVRERQFPPLPKDEKTCRKCQWSLVCRAPHLN